MPRSFRALVAFSLGLFLIPVATFAATLQAMPANGSHPAGATFPVRISVSSHTAVNAVSGTLNFPSDKLRVVSVSKTGSEISLWVQEPSFSNTSGTVNFEGVVPNPGYTGDQGTIITINFKVIGSGDAAVRFNSGSVLANDGNGTDVLKDMASALYSLGQGSSAAPALAAVRASGGGYLRPLITSPTHPDQDAWYSQSTAQLNWAFPEGVDSVRYSVTKTAAGNPSIVIYPLASTISMPALADGTWYFHAQFHGGNGWGSTSNYRLKVDTVKPESFTVRQLENPDATDPRPKFSVSATDITSGIKEYSFQIDKDKPETWRDDGTGIYQPQLVEPGDHVLLAQAYDQAGNSTLSSVPFSITGIVPPVITSYSAKVTGKDFILVEGTAPAAYRVHVTLAKLGVEPIGQTVHTRADGHFAITLESEKLDRGAYDLSAYTEDDRGARSKPTDPVTVLVTVSWFTTIASVILNVLTLLTLIFALVIALVAMILYSKHRLDLFRVRAARELKDAEGNIDKAFQVLQDDVLESMRILEQVKTQRPLTPAEKEIWSRLKSDIGEANKFVDSEVEAVERKIEGEKNFWER